MTITYPILPLGIGVEHKDYGELRPEDVKIVMVYKKPDLV